jgi:L-2-hydroxyglutarate oxidase LhgO
VGVVGAGVVGLAVARRIQQVLPAAEVTVWDKETAVAAHQSGHNSGVVHAGLYYTPGTLKATLCRTGNLALRQLCARHGIAVVEVGKLVVATADHELGRLRDLYERASANRVPDLAWVEGRRIGAIEPYAAGVAAIHSPHSAVVDFPAVAAALAAELDDAGGRLLLGTRVRRVSLGAKPGCGPLRVDTDRGPYELDRLVVCAGLGTDTIAGVAGRDVRIVPFRGEYYRLVPQAAQRVRGLIYPVPDPRYPFLGVHLTRSVDGGVLVGPNAVPALAREGYRRRDLEVATIATWLAWRGGRALARAHWRAGVSELRSSAWRPAFAAAARRYLPSLRLSELRRAPAGVRAQAVDRNGRLLDDFVIEQTGPLTVVRNAPSPAATSSLAIAEHLVGRLRLDE